MDIKDLKVGDKVKIANVGDAYYVDSMKWTLGKVGKITGINSSTNDIMVSLLKRDYESFYYYEPKSIVCILERKQC